MNKVRPGFFFLAVLACGGFAVVARAAVQVSYSFADRFSEVHAVYRTLFANADGSPHSSARSDEVIEVVANDRHPAAEMMAGLDLNIDGGLLDEVPSSVSRTSECMSSSQQKSTAGLGLLVPDVDGLVQLRQAGVTPAFVRDLARLGYGNLTAEDLSSLRNNGVEIQLVEALTESGYDRVSVEDLIRLRQSGVDAKFVRELHASVRSNQ